jgi:hypothetical protein
MGRQIIDINVIVFGLVQRAKTKTGFRRGKGKTKFPRQWQFCNETSLTGKLWTLGLGLPLLPKALTEPCTRLEADPERIRLHRKSGHERVAGRVQVALRFFVVVERVNVDAVERLSRGEKILDFARAPGNAWADALSRAPAHFFEQADTGRVFQRRH